MNSATNKYNFCDHFNIHLLKNIKEIALKPIFIAPFLRLGVTHGEMDRRVKQIFLTYSTNRIRREASFEVLGGGTLSSFFEKNYVDKNFSVNWRKHELQIKWHFVFFLFAKFLYLWLRTLGRFNKYLFFKKRIFGNNETISLWQSTTSISNENTDSLKKFLQFCRQGPIEALHGSLIVRYKEEQPLQDEALITGNHLFACLQSRKIKKLSTFFYFHYLHLKILLCFIFWAIQRHPFILLNSDSAQLSLVAAIQKNRVVSDIFITVSDFNIQEIWLHRCFGIRSHMVWYSQNSQSYRFYKSEFDPNFENPFFHFVRCDQHWIWDTAQQKWAETIFKDCSYNVVGPLLLYPYHPEKKLAQPPEFTVSVFDVTPLTESVAFDSYYGMGFNYCSYDVTSKFILEPIEICRDLEKKYGLKIRVQIKQKRIYGQLRSPEYQKLIDQLIATEQMNLFPPTSTIQEIAKNTSAVICFPFTSVAHVTRELDTASCFYDPLSLLQNEQKDIPVMGGKDNLTVFLEKCVVSFLNNSKHSQI